MKPKGAAAAAKPDAAVDGVSANDGNDDNSPKNWKHQHGKEELATFGAGCYWGTEKFFAHDFAKLHPGSILDTSVGFMSADPNSIRNPSYYDVCSGNTSHVEVAHIRYDSKKVKYEQLVKFFFQFHDPTTLDR